MAGGKICVASLLVYIVACVCAMPVEMDDTDTPEARQFIRRVTAQRAIGGFGGLGGIGFGGYGLGGLGGFGLGGFGGYGLGRFGGYGLGGFGGFGGLGGGLFFDEDPSAENDEDESSQDDEMASNHKTLVIPGHMIRKLEIKLNSNADIDNLNTEMGSSSVDSQKKWSSTGSHKKWASRVPHSKFRKLAKHMAKTDATSVDTDSTKMPSEENQQEFRVIRVPSNVFKMMKNRYQQDVQEALDSESSE